MMQSSHYQPIVSPKCQFEIFHVKLRKTIFSPSLSHSLSLFYYARWKETLFALGRQWPYLQPRSSSLERWPPLGAFS